ncbi:winged helix-turn-helix domain-containing protein [Streptomyces griseolus]|uniref:helix-turn-helix domain-containing protein n=1 Tax=Streptomyces TaxID=1883 RepID=UPI0022445AA4|nr:winged helix-turn-helix domain-containing protein [Streptomyces griseolus]MCW8216237.1 winged helix-turn-helix domain-containing protein [Streptomyces griseolus]
MIGRRFHLTYTIQGVRKLLVRNGWSCQVPARSAMEQAGTWKSGLASAGSATAQQEAADA